MWTAGWGATTVMGAGSSRCVAALLAVLAAAGCGGAAKTQEPGRARPRLTPGIARQLDARFRASVRDAGIPGASASIVFPDGRQWSAAAGKAVLRPARRMTTRTSFPLDSVTKVAAAALALRLAEEGRLRL